MLPHRRIIQWIMTHDSHDDTQEFHAEMESLRSLVKAQKEELDYLKKMVEFLRDQIKNPASKDPEKLN